MPASRSRRTICTKTTVCVNVRLRLGTNYTVLIHDLLTISSEWNFPLHMELKTFEAQQHFCVPRLISTYAVPRQPSSFKDIEQWICLKMYPLRVCELLLYLLFTTLAISNPTRGQRPSLWCVVPLTVPFLPAPRTLLVLRYTNRHPAGGTAGSVDILPGSQPNQA